MSIHPLSPPIFPATWASEWGEDQYGLWMAFSYQGNRHAFRWIPPGSFIMGSQEYEDGYSLSEVQIKVTLEDGFWLGEFPVTQGLYQAVMGDNPSHFKDKYDSENLPVEQVGWHDAQKFIVGLNQLHPKLITYLPFECQWEYACRAGTKTAFWFGDQIDLEQVNYKGGKGRGKEKKQTNPKGDYPANPWGLFDMHGNVSEWCLEPWQEERNDMSVVISLVEQLPKQIEKSLQLAQDNEMQRFPLRGGGRFCRSAARDWHLAAVRERGIGFRLSIGPEQP